MAPFKHFQLRSRANFIKYVGIELQLLKKEWKILLPCVIMQCTLNTHTSVTCFAGVWRLCMENSA